MYIETFSPLPVCPRLCECVCVCVCARVSCRKRSEQEHMGCVGVFLAKHSHIRLRYNKDEERYIFQICQWDSVQLLNKNKTKKKPHTENVTSPPLTRLISGGFRRVAPVVFFWGGAVLQNANIRNNCLLVGSLHTATLLHSPQFFFFSEIYALLDEVHWAVALLSNSEPQNFEGQILS